MLFLNIFKITSGLPKIGILVYMYRWSNGLVMLVMLNTSHLIRIGNVFMGI